MNHKIKVWISFKLKSGNWRIFEPRNLNLKSSDGGASKIMSNDAKLEPISLELNIENLLLSICVGVWVGGHPSANFLENFISFGANDNARLSTEKRTILKNRREIRFCNWFSPNFLKWKSSYPCLILLFF